MAIVELRVHGVSGTPPQSVLDDPHPRRVAGDDASAFWRKTNGSDGRFVEEAYEWGGLTSGSPMRATWVLLAPFALVNAAVAMFRPGRRIAAALTRVFALSLTVTLVGAVYIVSTDLLAWQCGNDDACVNRRGWTKFLGWSWLESPARRLAISVLLPVLVVVVLWRLARSTWQRSEKFEPTTTPQPRPDPTLNDTPFDDREVWNGRERGVLLRHVHVAAAVANVAALLAYAYLRIVDGDDALCTAALALSVAVLVVAVALIAPEVHPRVPIARRRAGVAVLVAAWTLLGVLVVYGCTAPAITTTAMVQLPGVDAVVTYLFVAQLLSLGAIRLASSWAPASLQVVALVVGAAFSAGVIVQAADFLAPGGTLILPAGVVWAARGVIALLALAIVVAIVAAIAKHRWLRDLMRASPIARAQQLAALTDHLRAITRVAMVPALIVLVGGAGIVVAIDREWSDWLVARSMGDWWHGWTVFGGRLVALFAITLMVLARQSYANRTVRRRVGIVWDVATFWPRRVHPLSPACYAERAVPELAGRLTELTRSHPEQPIFVSAHSQGSVIAAAALLLHHSQLPHVALVSYGSPLERLYAEYFPAYFGNVTFEQLDSRLGNHWLNLYRTTDPIGGAVARLGADRNWVVEPLDPQHPEWHSNYTREPYYADARTQADGWLTGRLYA